MIYHILSRCLRQATGEFLFASFCYLSYRTDAVSHGLEPKSEPGKVTIEIFEQDEKLHIIVADDGVGFDPNEERKGVKEGDTSTGVANTNRLLQILYHDNYTMRLDGKEGEGKRVEVILPKEKEGFYEESRGG